MGIDHKVEPLTHSKIETASAAMAKAFLDYPLLVWLIPDIEERKRFTYPYARKVIEYGLRYGKTYTEPSLTSAVVYLPPKSTEMTFIRLVRSGFFLPILRLSPNKFSRFVAYNLAAGKVHKKRLSCPHWYFFMIGVDPLQRKTGIGAALIEKGLQHADEERLPCYLETHVASNVVYLEKYGFNLVEETELIKGAPHNWAMIRSARL
jgi:GNAT superfamily N-acetyltransferase